MTAALVILGAMVGAPLRYLTDRAFRIRGAEFPWGTMVVNAVGCFLLAVLVVGARRSAVSGTAVALLGVGLCGALTTYSTFSYDTVRLFQSGSAGHAVWNLVGNVAAGFGAAGCGATLAVMLW